jgi:hypothetical protein
MKRVLAKSADTAAAAAVAAIAPTTAVETAPILDRAATNFGDTFL